MIKAFFTALGLSLVIGWMAHADDNLTPHWISPAPSQIVSMGQDEVVTLPTGSHYSCQMADGSACPLPPVKKEDELSAARVICLRHTSNSPWLYCSIGATSLDSGAMVFGANNCPPAWEGAWKACEAIEAKWSDSETAKREKERIRQIEKDLEFIKRIAGEKK